MQKRHRIRVAGIIALVAGLHLIVLWLLLAASGIMTKRTDSGGLQIVLIVRPPVSPQEHAPSHEKSSGRVGQHATAQSSAAASREPNPPAPIDWMAELESAAGNATADKSAQMPKDFGFPHLPSAPAKASQFGWDYAATHRVEAIPEGGLLVHLDDRCVLVLFPLPFIGCGIGEKEPNGDLFKSMGDSSDAQLGSAP
jgi:hypothetical protein